MHMANNYIWSDANRFYVAIESAYGIPAPIVASNRLVAFSFDSHQSLEVNRRRDKTGARTYLGGSATATRRSSFEVSAHLVSWDEITQPCFGPLVQAAMGGLPQLIQGLVISSVDGVQIQTLAASSLTGGSAISSGGEIRFVTTVQNSSTVSINAPFSITPVAGAVLNTTIGYRLATQLPSLSIYDYWDPSNSVSRLVTGAGVDKFQIDVKGDVHELVFSGPAADVLDSCSARFGVSGIGSFPLEPPVSAFDYSIVAGQLGQVWLGSPLSQVFTLTGAAIEINNNLLVRNQEFGSSYPMAIVPGPREIVTSFTLFAQADTETRGLYAAAKARTPVSALLQLGQRPGQMMAIYLPNVVPELPLFGDTDPYLLWQFKNSLAQGVANDEAYIAFA
jgi:hypothetical protein